MDEYLTVSQVAERKGVGINAVYKAIKEGRLPVVMILNRKAIRAADLDAWQPSGHGGPRPGQGRPRGSSGDDEQDQS